MKTNSVKKTKNSFLIPAVLIIIVLLVTGIILSLAISLLFHRFSFKFIKISGINSLFLGLGILLSLFLTGRLNSRVKSYLLALLSLTIVSGVSIIGFLYLFLLEPLFFFYRTNVVFLYLLINFIFIFMMVIISNGWAVFQKKLADAAGILEREKSLRKEIEEKLLLSRLNPHFLFNSLNLILSLLNNKKKAEEAILNLSELLRYSTDRDPMEFVNIKEEIDYIKKYLWIQKLRFDDRIEYEINNNYDFKILPMLLQPLIENSVKHNINNVEKLLISLNITKEKNSVIIEINDSAKKLKPEDTSGGKGLSITKKRVELINGSFDIINGGIVIKYDCIDNR